MEWQLPPTELTLSQSEIHVWQAKLNLPESQTAKFWEILSSDERVRADRFKFDHHRQRFIHGRGILRSLLAHYLQTKPELLQFRYGSHGKPFLKTSNLQFNLAHSDDLALYVFTYDRVIGIDVEKIRPMSDFLAIAHRFFSPRETDAIRRSTSQSLFFFRYWTCKEAFLKATGDGLSQLSQLEISIHQIVKLEKLPNSRSPQDWILEELHLEGNFMGAIATEAKNEKLPIKYFFYVA
jgi:4'-phosphopantetheinyl transferase